MTSTSPRTVAKLSSNECRSTRMWCCWNSPNHNPVTTHASAVRNSLAAISLNDPGQVGPLLVSMACTSLTTNLALRGKVATSNRLLGTILLVTFFLYGEVG